MKYPSGEPSCFPIVNEKGTRSQKDILEIIRKYCIKKVFFPNNNIEGEVIEYYLKTMAMVDNELEKPDAENDSIYTILSNLALIASNVKVDSSAQNDTRNTTHFSTMNRNGKYLLELLDSKWRISQRYENMQHNNKITPKYRFLKKSSIVSLWVCGISTIISGVLSAVFLNKSNNTITQKNLFENIGDWWNYQIIGLPMPISTEEKWRVLASKLNQIACISFVCCILLILLLFLIWIVRRANNRKNDHVRSTWEEYQRLKEAIEGIQDKMRTEDKIWAEM